MHRIASIPAAFLNIRGEGGAMTCLPCQRDSFTLANLCSGRAASLDGTCTAPYDVIIASDLVYSAVGARSLACSIVDNLKRGGVFLMVWACQGHPLT